METKGKPPQIEQAPLYAGIAKRCWAGILDLLACYLLIVVWLMVAVFGLADDSADLALWLGPAAIYWLYFAGFESSAARATPGKRASRIVVTDGLGARISFARASVRCLGRLAVLASAGLGMFSAFFDRRRRWLDDFIAGTCVHDVEANVGSGPRPWWRQAIGPIALLACVLFIGKTAIDAKTNYDNKARIHGLLEQVRSGLQAPYAKHYEATGQWPSAADLPFDHPLVGAVEISTDGTLTLSLIKPEKALLRLTPRSDGDGALSWTCRAESEHPSLFPASCRP